VDNERAKFLRISIANHLGFHASMLDVLPDWTGDIDAAYTLPHENANFAFSHTPVFGGGVMYTASYQHKELDIAVTSTSNDACEAICEAWVLYMDLLQPY
jgi:hypothetical protein